jgi:hypothetical protein
MSNLFDINDVSGTSFGVYDLDTMYVTATRVFNDSQNSCMQAIKMVVYCCIFNSAVKPMTAVNTDVVKCTRDPLCLSSSTCWDGSLPICPRQLGGPPLSRIHSELTCCIFITLADQPLDLVTPNFPFVNCCPVIASTSVVTVFGQKDENTMLCLLTGHKAYILSYV